ncbi:MAG: anti-sigma factor [Rhodospirillaceae bacterium]|nr:anti-sigma factor [Rhodospirillaceae bacterium]
MTQISLPTHHPAEEHLLDYAAGAIDPAAALATATHLTFCPACRDRVAELEAIGGALFDELPPAPVSAGARAALLARLDDGIDPRPETRPAAPAVGRSPTDSGVPPAAPEGGPLLPRPLAAVVGGGLETLPWRRVSWNVEEAALPVAAAAMRARLVRIKPGAAIPRHRHGGSEMVAVLAGGFVDAFGAHRRGDLAVHDEDSDHKPVAQAGEDCLCLVVDEAPVRLTGFFARWLNPFLR